jgi:hypothetical protein
MGQTRGAAAATLPSNFQAVGLAGGGRLHQKSRHPTEDRDMKFLRRPKRAIDYQALYREGYAILPAEMLAPAQAPLGLGTLMALTDLTPAQVHEMDDPGMTAAYRAAGGYVDR